MELKPRRPTVDINGALKTTNVGKKGGFIRDHGRMQELRFGALNAAT
jgi:hypothetical protein